MKPNLSFARTTFPFVLFLIVIITFRTPVLAQQNLGDYQVPESTDWNYESGKSSGDFYVFQNLSQKNEVALKKETAACANQQEFNKFIMTTIQNLQKEQWIVEQRKPTAPYAFAGQKMCHFMKLKSKTSGEQKFTLHYFLSSKIYQIEITSETLLNVPPVEVTDFIAQISTTESKSTFVKKQTNQPVAANADPNVLVSTKEPESATGDNLSGFKKVKTPPPPPQKPKVQTTAQKAGANAQKANTANSGVTATGATTTTSGGKLSNQQSATTQAAQVSQIEKGNIPHVKFSATDPCAPGSDQAGLPWEKSEAKSKINLPAGITVASTPIIPDIKSLSDVSYNAAVSAAFEGMRLVYGPMEDDEAKKFEAAWAPLFDYPTQEIVDYLNKMNPLVSQFLACRESYVRVLNDIQMVLFDASIAIETDDQQAWETAMAEAGMYSSAIPSLDAAMKSLANEMEKLGNPPNPNAAKCEARRRYKRMFAIEGPEGCWAGYQDNLFISDGSYSMISTDKPQVFGLVYSPKFEYIFKVNANGAEKYYSICICIDCNLGMSEYRGNCSNGSYGDQFIRENIFGKTQYTGNWIDGPRQGEESQYIEKFEYPDIPELSEVSDQQIHRWIELDNNNENMLKGFWTPQFQKMLQMRTLAPAFYETALRWTEENRWQQFNYSADSWMVPDDLLIAFQNDLSASAPKNEEKEPEVTRPVAEKANPTSTQASEQEAKIQAEQDRVEAIAFHNEMISVIKRNLDKDMAERNEVVQALSKAKTKAEADEHLRRLKDYDLRIINQQSNMQAEQDLVASHQTGEIVHTRTVFDDYARNKFIEDMKENAARVDATRRIAERINRQIELLPWEQRAAARETAEKVLDGKTIASGDLEKAKKLVSAINNQVQGYAEYDGATAKEAEINASENEFYAQTTVMAAGALFVGFGSAGLAQAFGTEAAMTIYGTKMLGAVYGGTTGAIAGGPKEGLTQAVSWWSPKGFAAMQFLEGYQHAGYEKDATASSQVWNGVKQAGTAIFIGKVFEFGVGVVAKGSYVAFGKDSRLFKPIVQTPSQRSKQVLDAMRTTQNLANAQDDIKAFQNLEIELATLKRNPAANAQKIGQLEGELQQLSASINASYHAKWLLKYKTPPGIRRQFDLRVQKNYSEMTPGMIRRLEQQGYNMDGIEFRQFRNSTSGGSSSMDLDLGPVMKGTGNEPGIKMFKSKMIVKKDGSVVTLEQFTDDAQKAMNAEYKSMTGISAPSSDMNLVTSAHKEAFSTPRLLDHKIDFSSYTAEEIASVGKVLSVKMDGINRNQMLTNTAKMQAKCRESSKEIENMLLRKIRDDLAKAPAGSAKQKQLQADINYWEDMLKRFKTIGTEETDPMKIIQINREIMKDTGGKDVTGVINDLIAAFKPKA